MRWNMQEMNIMYIHHLPYGNNNDSDYTLYHLSYDNLESFLVFDMIYRN